MRFLLPFFLSTPLFGEEMINDITESGGSYHFLGELMNMLLTLAFVVVLIFVSVWFLKKVLRSRMNNLNQNNGIKILERRPLTQKSSLYLIDVLGKGALISESSSGIQLITEFPDGVKVEELLEQIQSEKHEKVSFSENFINKFKALAKKT